MQILGPAVHLLLTHTPQNYPYVSLSLKYTVRQGFNTPKVREGAAQKGTERFLKLDILE